MLDADDLYDAWDRLVPGMAPGTLRSRKAGEQQGAFDEYGLAQVKLKRLTKDDLEAIQRDGVTKLTTRHRILQVWRQALEGAAPSAAPDPKVKDEFRDSAGVRWVVEKVLEHKLLGNVWNLLVNRAAGT